MADSLYEHIDNFLQSFRASNRPFTPGRESCAYCWNKATTYCENCHAGLCESHADSETYSDADICKDSARCEERLAAVKKTEVKHD